MRHIETQLHGAGDFIDILPAGTGGKNETLDKLVLVDRDIVGDGNLRHGACFSHATTGAIK
jgi:hypothetical protein